MRIEDFNDRLKHAVIVADGAMGSLLYESVGPQRSVDELNSSDAESVFRVHQTYIEAGALQGRRPEFGPAQVLWCRRCMYWLRAGHAVPLLGKRHRRQKRDL